MRVVIEEPCEHGTMIAHLIDGTEHRVFNAGGWSDEVKDECPGGSRRVLDPGSYVLIQRVDGKWPINNKTFDAAEDAPIRTKQTVELLARSWCAAEGHIFDDCIFDDQHREHAVKVLDALQAAGLDIVRSESAIVIHPGRVSGEPTIGQSRLPAETVAGTYWLYGLEKTLSNWDHLSEEDVMVCCWFMARHGTSPWRRRWKDWLPDADRYLWSPRFAKTELALPPTKQSCAEPERREQ